MPSIQLGTWLSIGSPVIAELAAEVGFDWVLLDLEHGCASEGAIPEQLRACRGSKTLPVVRIPSSDPDRIARILDWGAGGVMAPHINTAADATAYVRAMRYPPHGCRGVSRSVRAYGYGLKSFQEQVKSCPPLFLAQIETSAAVRNIDAIAAVDGVDVLFVGPADLQHDLSVSGESELSYSGCLARVAGAAASAGKQAGILCRDVADLAGLISQGFRWIAVDSDLGILRTGFQRAIRQSLEA